MIDIFRVFAIARKETYHLTRDRRSLYLALGIPVMLLVLFGYALSLDVDEIPLAVWDQEKSSNSRDLIKRLTSSGYFQDTLHTESYEEIVAAIDRRMVTVAIVIPADFTRNQYRVNGASIQAVVDASDSTRAGIAINYLQTIVATLRQDLVANELADQAVTELRQPLESRIRLLYNPELESRVNIIPGLIAIIMMVIAALLTSQTIVREWENGTMEQLISTPVQPREMVLGKLIPYFVLGYIDLVVVYLTSQYVFDVPFRGSVTLMFLLSGLFLATSLSLGIMISAGAQSQLFATQFALLGTFLPSFLLSGFVFPIENMPLLIELASYLVPARYYVTIVRSIYLKGVGVEILAAPIVMLAVFGLITSVVAAKRLGQRLK